MSGLGRQSPQAGAQVQAGVLAALSHLGASAEGLLPAMIHWRASGVRVVPALRSWVERLLPALSCWQDVVAGVPLVSRRQVPVVGVPPALSRCQVPHWSMPRLAAWQTKPPLMVSR